MKRWTRALFILPLLALTACNPTIRATREVSLNSDWNDYQRVHVRVQNGGVELLRDDVQGIEITGEKYASGYTIEEAESNVEQIEVSVGADHGDDTTFLVELNYPLALRGKSAGADLVIRIPKSCPANVRTSNGRIIITGMTGTVEARSSNGSIRIADVDGNVEARTSNGRMRVINVTGDVDVRTSNGAVFADDIAGCCRIDTSNGAIECDVHPGADGYVDLETSNGSIELEIPADLAASLRLSTSNGRVRTRLGDAVLQNVDADRKTFYADMNGGGCRVEARTSNGSINARCR
jgi:hypothetical protein